MFRSWQQHWPKKNPPAKPIIWCQRPWSTNRFAPLIRNRNQHNMNDQNPNKQSTHVRCRRPQTTKGGCLCCRTPIHACYEHLVCLPHSASIKLILVNIAARDIRARPGCHRRHWDQAAKSLRTKSTAGMKGPVSTHHSESRMTLRFDTESHVNSDRTEQNRKTKKQHYPQSTRSLRKARTSC